MAVCLEASWAERAAVHDRIAYKIYRKRLDISSSLIHIVNKKNNAVVGYVLSRRFKMKKVLNTIFIIMLALGLMGIILGISMGLYRNDMLARIQAAEESDLDEGKQAFVERNQAGDLDADELQIQEDRLLEFLLWGNLHTICLAAGTLLTLLSVVIFLIRIKGTIRE